MGGRDCEGVFPWFCFTLCNGCFLVFHQSTTRLVCGNGFERLGFVASPFFDGFGFFVLHFRNVGPSRRRVEPANLYGLCFAISAEPNREPRPHISEACQSISRIGTSQTRAENGWFRLFGVQQMRRLVHCWPLRMGNRAFAVFLERAGSDFCLVRVSLRVTF